MLSMVFGQIVKLCRSLSKNNQVEEKSARKLVFKDKKILVKFRDINKIEKQN